MDRAKSLKPTDWIKAGFRALTAGGPQAVRVERLARDLAVTKGSFYWHFADLSALQAAMLDHWQSVATEGVIQTFEAEGASLEDLLTGLLTQAVAHAAEDYGGPLAEAAIRAWARDHADAARAVALIDRRRLAFLQSSFESRGFAPVSAGQRAALFYSVVVGAEILSDSATLSPETITVFVRDLVRNEPCQGKRT